MISIHTLTWRVTPAGRHRAADVGISIHTLTQRVTRQNASSPSRCGHFNPHPHAEGDVSLDRQADATHDFNPHPHAEGDVRDGHLYCVYPDISIHTLTQRVTKLYMAKNGQLQNFNPHPHAEGDRIIVSI